MSKQARIITYHNSYSYGACLQAWATCALLEEFGFEARLIDYKNLHEEESLGKSSWYFIKRGRFRESLKIGIRNIMGYKRFAHNGFDAFHSKMNKTIESYSSLEELSSIKTDCLVAGSDQVWNPAITGLLDPAFLLDFGEADKRVSIASSMGNAVIDKEADRALIKQCLSRFSGISVREHHTKRQVDDIVNTDSFVCLDPTLLLNPVVYNDFEERPNIAPVMPYILVFTLNSRSTLEEEAWTEYSTLLQMPVYRIINNRYCGKGIKKNLHGVSPCEFVWLIRNAAFVCTDSFHGTAVSIAMQTPFALFPSKTGNNVRMQELLKTTKLLSQMDNLDGERAPVNVDFSYANSILEEKREEFRKWFQAVIMG